jgi:arsenate reductase (glutaredoxin)
VLTIYHNPRCSKSRQTLQLIEQNNQAVDIVEYLKSPLNKSELQSLVSALGVNVRDIIRTSEAEYKEQQLKNPALSDEQLLDAIVSSPKLMQRPIVVKEDRAIIGRPPENVLELIND